MKHYQDKVHPENQAYKIMRFEQKLKITNTTNEKLLESNKQSKAEFNRLKDYTYYMIQELLLQLETNSYDKASPWNPNSTKAKDTLDAGLEVLNDWEKANQEMINDEQYINSGKADIDIKAIREEAIS